MTHHWRPDGNRGLQSVVQLHGKSATFHIERDHGRGAESYTLRVGRRAVGQATSLECAQLEAEAWLEREHKVRGDG